MNKVINCSPLGVGKRCATNADCRLADRRPADLQTCRLADLQTCRHVRNSRGGGGIIAPAGSIPRRLSSIKLARILRKVLTVVIYSQYGRKKSRFA